MSGALPAVLFLSPPMSTHLSSPLRPPNGIELIRTRGLAKSPIQDNLLAGARVHKGTPSRPPDRHHEPHDGVGQQQGGWGLTKAATSGTSSARYLRKSPWPGSLAFQLFPVHAPATPSASALPEDLSKWMSPTKDACQDRLPANREGLSKGNSGKTPRGLSVPPRLRPPQCSPSPNSSRYNWR